VSVRHRPRVVARRVQKTLCGAHQNAGGDAVAGHVADCDGQRIGTQAHDVKKVSSDVRTRTGLADAIDRIKDVNEC